LECENQVFKKSMSNYIIGDLISRLRVALNGHLSRIKVLNSKISLNILAIFYENGLICGYQIENQFIMVYLKYYKNLPVFLNIKLISTPGKKVYWSLDQLTLKQNKRNFNGFYIISTSKGLITSNSCILGKNICGKILLKVYV